MPSILLDTCALIYLMEGRLAATALALLEEAYDAARVTYLSPVSGWEVGLLMSRGRLRLAASPSAWFRQAASQPGLGLVRLPVETLIASSFLPGSPPRDPADRIFIATARELGCPLMTSDRALLAYAEEGHMQVLPC